MSLGHDVNPRPRPGPGAPEASAGGSGLSHLVHLRAAGTSVLLDFPGDALPVVVHWGGDLGDVGPLADLALAAVAAPVQNEPDTVSVLTVLPEQSRGWPGAPGLSGHRAGADWSTRFTVTERAVDAAPDSAGRPAGGRVAVQAVDAAAQLELRVELELLPTGLLRHRAHLTNTASEVYDVGRLALALPLPAVATEVFDLAGRWGRKRDTQRLPLVVGSHTRENRRGRTGPDAPLVLAVGTPGFGLRSGEVWAQHVAVSGNHRAAAERLSTGGAVLTGGELLLPGEVRLATGAAYSTPWVYAAHSEDGLDDRGALPRAPPVASAPPQLAPPGRREHLGGRLLRPRPRPAGRPRPRSGGGGRRTLRAGRRVVPPPARRPGRPG